MPKCRQISGHCLCTATFLTLAVFSTILSGCGGSALPPTLSSIAVTPLNASIPQGMTQQLKATGVYSDSSRQDLTTTVTWISSATNVLTISPTGLASAVGIGSTKVEAVSGSITASTSFTITAAVPPTLSSIAVTPLNASIPQGMTQQLKATGIYSDSSRQDLTTTVTWISSATNVLTISPTGLASAVGIGTTKVEAVSGSITASTSFTITAAVPPTLSSIAVTPLNASIPQGMTQQLKATGIYSDSSRQDLTTTVTWISSATNVLTISPTGLASAVGIGTTKVEAVSGSITASDLVYYYRCCAFPIHSTCCCHISREPHAR